MIFGFLRNNQAWLEHVYLTQPKFCSECGEKYPDVSPNMMIDFGLPHKHFKRYNKVCEKCGDKYEIVG